MPNATFTPCSRASATAAAEPSKGRRAFSTWYAGSPSSSPSVIAQWYGESVGTRIAPDSAICVAARSPIRLPCSIVRTPNSTARRTASSVYACAAT